MIDEFDGNTTSSFGFWRHIALWFLIDDNLWIFSLPFLINPTIIQVFGDSIRSAFKDVDRIHTGWHNDIQSTQQLELLVNLTKVIMRLKADSSITFMVPINRFFKIFMFRCGGTYHWIKILYSVARFSWRLKYRSALIPTEYFNTAKPNLHWPGKVAESDLMLAQCFVLP